MQRQRASLFVMAALACAAFVVLPGSPIPHASQLGLGGTASAEESIDISYFYDKLSQYGQWVEHPRFGYVWLPQNVAEDWRPYTIGHWINTKEYGWYWESEEPFAWAVYHYGRWGYDEELGWFWVPGNVWAPAWVEWRYPKKASKADKKSYVGWAPVGPRMSGYAYGVEADYEPPVAESWVFVEPEYIVADDIYDYVVPVTDIDIVYINTTVVYQPRYRGGVVYNWGIPREEVQAFIDRPIETREIVRVQDPNKVTGNASGDEVQAFAPRVEKAKPGMAPQQITKPDEIKPKAKLKTALQEAPNDMGPTASELPPSMKEGIAKEAKPELGAEPVEPGAPGKVGKEEGPQPPSSDVLGEKELKGPEPSGKKKESEAIGKAETPTEPSGPSGPKKGKKKGDIGSAEEPSPPTGSGGKQGKQKSKGGLAQGEEGPGPSAGPGPRKKGKQAAKRDEGPPSAGPSRRGADGPGKRGRFSEGDSSGGPAGGGERGGKKGRFGEAGPSGGQGGPGGDRRRGPREPG